ncbi:hypothetical protein FXO37_35976 [Capsicum annuum]|nr:hypothetical protein FXO37_35976 [Capsicum annuum]
MRLVILHALRRVLMDQIMETSKSQNVGEKDQTTETLKSQNVSVPERLKAEAKFNLSAGNLSFNDLEVSSGSKSNVLNQHKRLRRKCMPKRNKHVSSKQEPRKRKKQRSNIYREISISKQLPCLPSTVNLTTAQKKPSTEEQPISRKVVASRASCIEKVSHRLYQSVNRKRKKQRSNSYREISILKQLPYREPGRRSEKNKDGQSWEEAGARAAEADGGWTEREKF